MSSSTKKKLRQAEKEAGNYKKSVAEREAAVKAKKEKRNTTIALIVIAALVVFALVVNFFPFQKMTALTVNGEKVSAAELKYYYGEQFMDFYQSYGDYAAYFGLDTSAGIAGLKKQACPLNENGGTWAEYFLEMAENQIKQVKALCGYANENGIALTDDELTQVDNQLDNLALYAQYYGYKDLNAYLASNYGDGVTEEIAAKCLKDSMLAGDAYAAYQDALTYTDAELEEHYQSFNGEQDIYDYAYYLVSAEKETTTDEEGNETEEVTDATMNAAKKQAERIKDYFQGNLDVEGDLTEQLTAAACTVADEAEATYSSATVASTSSYYEWISASRQTGDVTVAENSGSNGYFVVVYIGRSDNHYNTVNVRHILVKAVADENGEYTEEALAEAKQSIEDIYAQWQAGDKTEESFAALAEEHSEDTGSSANGGLYENVYRGQMVPEFNDFCFADGRKAGDTGIVEGDNGSYHGYHLIYFSGEGELYSSVLAKSDLVDAATHEWMDALLENYEIVHGSGYRYAA